MVTSQLQVGLAQLCQHNFEHNRWKIASGIYASITGEQIEPGVRYPVLFALATT